MNEKVSLQRNSCFIFISNLFSCCTVKIDSVTDTESLISHLLNDTASAFPSSQENPFSSKVCRSDPLLTLSIWRLRGRKSDFRTWTLTQLLPVLWRKILLSGKPLLIIGRLMGVKWELFITPPPLPHTSIRLHRSSYLWRKSSWQLSPMSSSFSTVSFIYTQGEKTHKSFFFFFPKLALNKEKTPAGHPQSQRRENKMLVTEGEGGRGLSVHH